LEVRAPEIERQVKSLAFAGQIFPELADVRLKMDLGLDIFDVP